MTETRFVTLLVETLLISACMLFFSGLPLLSESVRRHHKLFFLVGTGALGGILFFDLLPDLVGLGGAPSLWSVGAVWILYSIFHFSHLGHHHDGTQHATLPFLFSMIAHCLASGLLLATSDGVSQGLNRSVFLALIAHKAYEAMTVSSVLLEKQKMRVRALLSILAYSLALPIGVLLTYFFRAQFTPKIALIAMSLAAGTLLGCLLFDFVIPSLGHVRNRRLDVAWIIAGLTLTQLIMRLV